MGRYNTFDNRKSTDFGKEKTYEKITLYFMFHRNRVISVCLRNCTGLLQRGCGDNHCFYRRIDHRYRKGNRNWGASVTLALGEVSENSDGNTAPDNSNNSDSTPEMPSGSAPDGNGGFGGSSEVTQGDSANTITEDGTYTGTTYTSTGDDENALRVDGATVTIKNATLTANNSEALVIEGQNSIALENCDVIGNMSDTKGSSGSNGAQVEFTADSQTINGDIIVDNISTLDFSLTNGIVLNGTINFNGYTITLADGTVLK